MADYFYGYKQALKSRYDLVKVGVNASYLLEPTTAKLRNLCMSYYRDNQITTDDKRIFQQFFGFEYDHAKKSEVSARTDRFKPIKTFLLNETDIAENNIAAAEMLAVLLDYELRPFRKFVAHNNHITVQQVPSATIDEEQTITDGEKPTVKEGERSNDKPEVGGGEVIDVPETTIVENNDRKTN